MAERDRATDEAAFIELTDRETEDRLDLGVRTFDAMVVESESFVNDNGGAASTNLDQALNELNNEWQFHRDVASISGRIYLADYLLKEHMADLLGEPLKDENGCLYFMAEDLDVRSQGIVRGPHDYLMGEDEEIRSDVKLGYGFSLAGEDSPFHQFVVYPGEVSQHVYSTPSIEAIDFRLHRDWPEAMELVDKLISEGERETHKLPRRLTLITRRLQTELIESADFREWLGEYIDARIDFDNRWSVALTMHGPISFVDEDEDQLSLDIQDEHTEHCFQPDVAFILKETDGQPAVHAAFIAGFPHPADQNYSDMAIVPVSSVVALRSTRRTRSLVEIAMAGKYSSENEPHATQVRPMEEPRDYNYESVDTLAAQRQFQKNLDSFVAGVRKVRRSTFSNQEAAMLASRKLCESFSAAVKDISDYRFPLRVRGDGASLPNVTVASDTDSDSLVIKFDRVNPVGAPDASMEVIGYMDGIFAGVETIEHEEGESYKPLPQMIVVIDNMSVEVAHMPIPRLVGDLKKRALVRLDSFGAIKPAQLEMVDDFRSAFVDFKRKNIASPLIGAMSKLNQAEVALGNDRSDYTALKSIDLFRNLANLLERYPDQADDAMQVVTKMFKHATTRITGDVYNDGRLINDFEIFGEIEALIAGVPNQSDTGPAFVLQTTEKSTEPVSYIPLRSITGFLY